MVRFKTLSVCPQKLSRAPRQVGSRSGGPTEPCNFIPHRYAFAAAKWRKSPASGLPTLSGTATGAVWLGAWGQFTNSTCAGLRYSSEGGVSVCLYLHRAGAGSGYSVTDTVRAVSTGATPAFRVSPQDYASIEPRL
jgi:hypothetical protein